MSVKVQVGIKGRNMPAGGKALQVLAKNSDNDFDVIWTTPAGGAAANIPQPAVTVSGPDCKDGSVGVGESFARNDHQHELNVSSTVADVKMNGDNASLGTKNTYARTDHVHVHDSTKADADDLTTLSTAVSAYEAKFVAFTVTLDKDDWADGEQTITDAKFIETGYAYIVTPSPSDIDKYADGEIYAEDVSVATEMTFHCGDEPTADIDVNIVRIPV